MMRDGIRRCAEPGKFEGELLVSKLLYQLSLDGCDDDFGDVTEYGAWYGLLKGPFKGFQNIDDETPLTDEEKGFLAALAGVIVSEDDLGFIAVSYYEDEAELMQEWNRLVREYEDVE